MILHSAKQFEESNVSVETTVSLLAVCMTTCYCFLTFHYQEGEGGRGREAGVLAKYGTILGICPLHLTHPSEHSPAVNTHLEQWAFL